MALGVEPGVEPLLPDGSPLLAAYGSGRDVFLTRVTLKACQRNIGRLEQSLNEGDQWCSKKWFSSDFPEGDDLGVQPINIVNHPTPRLATARAQSELHRHMGLDPSGVVPRFQLNSATIQDLMAGSLLEAQRFGFADPQTFFKAKLYLRKLNLVMVPVSGVLFYGWWWGQGSSGVHDH